MHREWKLQTHRQIIFHYYLSILGLCSLFLLVGHAINLPFGCTVARVFLHYFILTTLMWSAVEAQYLYIASVKMDDIQSCKAIPICCFLAWSKFQTFSFSIYGMTLVQSVISERDIHRLKVVVKLLALDLEKLQPYFIASYFFYIYII